MSIWTSIGAWIQKLEAGVVALIEKSIIPAIDFLNVIKNAVNSTVVVDIVALLGGAVAAADLEWISNELTVIINALGVLEDGTVGTPAQSAQAVTSKNVAIATVAYLKTLPNDDIRDAHYVKLASLLAKAHTTETKFLPTEIDDYTQQTYTKSVVAAQK